MSETKANNTKLVMSLAYAAAATTVIAGILHLIMAPRSISHNMGEGVLFLVGGILQIFWAVPVIRRWGRVWQIIGIVGTAIFVILFFSDRLHLLPEGNILGGTQSEHIPQGEFTRGNITGEFPRDGPRGPSGGFGIGLGGSSLPIEICQIAFIGLYAILGKMISKRK